MSSDRNDDRRKNRRWDPKRSRHRRQDQRNQHHVPQIDAVGAMSTKPGKRARRQDPGEDGLAIREASNQQGAPDTNQWQNKANDDWLLCPVSGQSQLDQNEGADTDCGEP
jgi:hypothetical protein